MRKNPKYPKPTSPALLRSALAQAWEAGSWPGSLQGVYGPRRAAEGPRSVNLCILENAGPAVLLMGPIQDAPHPPTRLLEEEGYYVFWYQISSAVNSSRARNDSPHQEGCAVESTNQKKTHTILSKWLQTEPYVFLQFTCISHHHHMVQSDEIAWSGGNTMI